MEEWNSVEVPCRRGSSQWMNAWTTGSGFGKEDDRSTGEAGRRELVLIVSVL